MFLAGLYRSSARISNKLTKKVKDLRLNNGIICHIGLDLYHSPITRLNTERYKHIKIHLLYRPLLYIRHFSTVRCPVFPSPSERLAYYRKGRSRLKAGMT